MGDVTVQKVGVDFPRADNSWCDAEYRDPTAQVCTQGGAIIAATDHNTTLLDVPLSDNNSLRESDFTKLIEKGEKTRKGVKTDAARNHEKGPVYVDRRALHEFLVDPKHRELVEQLAADHVTLPTALGHIPIQQASVIGRTRKGL
jgi:hypothetical protein